MDEYYGSPEYKIWLIGESNPSCEDIIKYPLDKRHPARHNIWTSVLDEIQNCLYIKATEENIRPIRLDSRMVYIRNAVQKKSSIPSSNSLDWRNLEVNRQLTYLRNLIEENSPSIIFTFGQFAYEFARRARNHSDKHQVKCWNTIELGNQFRESLSSFGATNKQNIIPLFHFIIVHGNREENFIEVGKKFIGDDNIEESYFEYAGRLIGEKLFEFRNNLDIWM